MSEPDGDAAVNRALWTLVNAELTDERAHRAWETEALTWGLSGVPDVAVGALVDVAGLDVIELGCGTAELSAWLARQGARPVGVDVTPAQLQTARRCQQRFGLSFPLIESSAEHVPLPDDGFDLVVSEYGASVWCDPELWVPEAARLLRPRGRLVFLTNSVVVTLCVPEDEGFATTSLQRPQRGLHRVRWPGGGVEFHPSHGDWIRVLRSSGFEIEALHELYATADTTTDDWYEIATADWSRQWPAEDLWVARLAQDRPAKQDRPAETGRA